MKTIRKFVLLAIILCGAGCATTVPDPLAGWHFSGLDNLDSNKAIVDDYQDYIRKLPSRQKGFVGSVGFFEDGAGQHAVGIQMGVNGTWWNHILIYDKENKRIKVVVYRNGGYRS